MNKDRKVQPTWERLENKDVNESRKPKILAIHLSFIIQFSLF